MFTKYTTAKAAMGIFLALAICIFTIMGCSGDGGNASSVTNPPAEGARTAAGIFFVFGPVHNATVQVIDVAKGVIASGVTGPDGRFSFPYDGKATGYYQITGGTDVATGLSVSGPFYGPLGTTAVGPLSTLANLGWPNITDAQIYNLAEIPIAARTWQSIATLTDPSNILALKLGYVRIELAAECLSVFVVDDNTGAFGDRKGLYREMAYRYLASLSKDSMAAYLVSLDAPDSTMDQPHANLVAGLVRELLDQVGLARNNGDLGSIFRVCQQYVLPALADFRDGKSGAADALTNLTANLHTLIYGGGSVNHAPVATNGSVSTNQGVAVSGTMSATDADSDAMNFTITTSPLHGTATITNAATGAYSYSPTAGYTGADTFSFTATDSHGSVSNVATITATINGVGPNPATYTLTTSGSVLTFGRSLRLVGPWVGNTDDGAGWSLASAKPASNTLNLAAFAGQVLIGGAYETDGSVTSYTAWKAAVPTAVESLGAGDHFVVTVAANGNITLGRH